MYCNDCDTKLSWRHTKLFMEQGRTRTVVRCPHCGWTATMKEQSPTTAAREEEGEHNRRREKTEEGTTV